MTERAVSNRLLDGMLLFAPLFLSILFSAAPAVCGQSATWSNGHGPEGGGVNVLVIDPTSPQTIYAGTDGGGVFESTDGGSSWSPVNARLSNLSVQALAIDPASPQTIYAGTRGGGVFRYAGADGWSAVNANGMNTSILTLALDPTSPQTIYAGTDGGGVFKSTDGSKSWSAVNSGLTDSTIRALVIDPISPQTIYAGSSSKGVFKSTNGGGSWSAINSGLTDSNMLSLAIDRASPQTIYAGAAGGLFRSTDGGSSWNATGTSSSLYYVSSLAFDPAVPQTIYAGSSGGGVFKSVDQGNSWTVVNTGLANKYVSTLVIDPASPQRIYAGTDGGGVFNSTNGGGSWMAANTGLAIARVYGLAIDATSTKAIYAGTYRGGAFKSRDEGESWNAINSGLAPYIRVVAIDPTSPQTIYAGSYGGGVYKSTDAGSSWTKINTGLAGSNISALAIDPASPQTLYAGSLGKGVFKSTNGGGSWSDFSQNLTNNNIRTLVIDPTSTQTIYAGTDAGVFKRKPGAEEIWNLTDIALSKTAVRSLAIDPTSPQTIYAGTQSAGMLKSTAGGNRWISINKGLGTSPILTVAIDPTFPSRIYVGTGGGVSKSADGGGSWRAINKGLPSALINALALDPTSPQMIYAGTYGMGVWVHLPPCSSLSAGGATKCETAGVTEETQAGYAKLALKSGAPPYATAVFTLKQGGITVSEAGVPASPPTTSARIFIDYRSGVNAVPGERDSGTIDINTGIAIVNHGSATADVTYTLRNLEGTTLTVGHGTIAARNHFAYFIDQLNDKAAPDFSLSSDFKNTTQFGTLEIASDQPLSVLALRGTNNQANHFLVTTTPIADLTQPLSYSPTFFPQLADGGGYTTSLILMNTSNKTETGQLKFLDNEGHSLVVNQAGGTAGSSFAYSIPVGGAYHFQTDGAFANAHTGWIQLIPDASTAAPASSGVFSYNPENMLLSESGIPAAAPTKHARVYVDLSNNHNTGLAIANLSVNDAAIAINAFQTDGVTGVGTTKGPLKLVPGGHDAEFADQLVSGLPVGFTGVLDISATTPFAALTLRSLNNERGDFLMTTFPIADMNLAAPSPIAFPQVVDGGGYITEFILISPGQGAGTTLDYYYDDGTLADFSN